MINTKYWMQIQQIADLAKWTEQAEAKAALLLKVIESLDEVPETIVFPSFNPVVLCLEKTYDCTVVADQSVKHYWNSSSNFIDDLSLLTKPADLCLALDEYLTYAETEQDQRDRLDQLKNSTNGWLITTCQDYKNTAPHKRSQAENTTHFNNSEYIVIDQTNWDKNNRQNWQNYIYMIKDNHDLTVLGPEMRRTMYFKQLAKYSSDIDGTNYMIQKNLLYRGFFKKHYEHIISVRFG